MKKKLQAFVVVTMFLALPAMAIAQPVSEFIPVVASADSVASTVLKWVGVGGVVLVGILLGIFGVKKLLRHMSIIQSIRNGVASWNEHAKGTDYKWDDAASKLLLDVTDKLLAEGRKELSDKEKMKVRALANAEAKIVGPDPAVDPSAKKEEEG
jgi:hypothetical protein